jgi:REP element-mobilizing transposase RayT
MNIRNEIIEPDSYYHIYNRGINSCPIFQNEENQRFFLNKFYHYLHEVCDVYAFCLMQNHFHFLIKIKPNEELLKFAKKNIKSALEKETGLHSISNIFSKQMGKFISCFSQSYNKINNRHGALLESPFKRIKIDTEEYLKNLIIYIHLNPTDSKLNYQTFKFSSYAAILSTKKSNVKRDDVIALFENKENFIYCHSYPSKYDFRF